MTSFYLKSVRDKYETILKRKAAQNLTEIRSWLFKNVNNNNNCYQLLHIILQAFLERKTSINMLHTVGNLHMRK